MIEKATLVLAIDAEYGDDETLVLRDELERFLEEYFGDTVRLESFDTDHQSPARCKQHV